MTQDQYGQPGGSGYVGGDVVPDDERDESGNKPMTRFQKVASALRGDRPDRDDEYDTDEATASGTAGDDAATGQAFTGQTTAGQPGLGQDEADQGSFVRGDIPTNPDVPQAATHWGSPAASDTAAGVPDSRDSLDAQEQTGPNAVRSGPGETIAAGEDRRDYWDEPGGTAAAAQPDTFGDTTAATSAPEASTAGGTAEAGDQPGVATVADVPAVDATMPTGRHAATDPADADLTGTDDLAGAGDPVADGSPVTTGAPVADGTPVADGSSVADGTPVADGSPAAEGAATAADTATTPATTDPAAAGAVPASAGSAGATAADTAAADAAVTDAAAGTPATPPGDLRPGEAAGKLGDFSDLTFGSLIPDAAAYTDQWQQVQFRFVDDPRGSVTEAAEIVKQVTGKLETAIQERLQAIQQRQQAIQEQQKSLDSRWGEGSNADTETLRETLRMYKTFLDQLVGQKA